MSAARARASAEEGRILVLALVYALIAVALVLTVVAASAVHLQRKRVLAIADAAAADAADAVDERAYYAPDGGVDGRGVPLSEESVRASVTAYLERSGAAAEVGGIAVGDGTGSPDGRTAVVVLVAHLAPPWSAVGPVRLGGGVDVRVSSRAVARLR
ncbi:hypothetical protein [Kineococcus glutinatus]|uniref:hypothetical protein n=1 Tax=Kineococcus glutinatus TaxID=1070872 RepID=UPI0031EA8761